MKLTTAEEWNSRWLESREDTLTELILQIQADALRFAASQSINYPSSCDLAEYLCNVANQLHPLPELPKVVTWLVEYEIPPLRAIYQCEVDHNSEQEAQEYVKALQPTWRIRKITLRP